MIQFFRKIRQDLLSNGKTRRYLKYAIGEIVLVVIGILIALQINNWHTNRINKDKEREYLIGLQTDLENQITSFDDGLQIFDYIIEKGEEIIIEFTKVGKLTEIDSINNKLTLMMYAITYPEAKTTFNELTTTGHINLFRDKVIRSSVIAYYQFSEDAKLRVSTNIENVYYNQIFPIIRSSIVINTENFGFPTAKVDSNLLNERLLLTYENRLNQPEKEFEIINAVSLRVIETKTNRTYFTEAKNAAEALLQIIESEIKGNK